MGGVAKAAARGVCASRELESHDAEQPRDEHERHVAVPAAFDETHLGIGQPDGPSDCCLAQIAPDASFPNLAQELVEQPIATPLAAIG